MANRKYLVVDDNRALAENLAEIFRERGHEVKVCERAQDALALIEKETFHAVLTDMRMPTMNGAEFIQKARRFDPGLPAILFTAFAEDASLRVARHHGLLAVLAKPVPIHRLLELLEVAQRDAFVALVEDDEALLDNLTEALRARGWTALTATSLEEARQFGEVKPFAALVDLKVPGGPLGEAVPLLETRYPGLPMVVMTAHSDKVPRGRPHAVFPKPFQTEKLLSTLEGLRPGAAG